MNRRSFIETTTAATLAMAAPSLPSFYAPKKGMGVASASYAFRWYSGTESKKYPPFTHAMQMLEHCKKIGAAGIQAGMRNWTGEDAGKIRDRREELELYLEGQTLLPENETDLARFEKEIQQAKEAGAKIIRTVCLRGRRYENFDNLESFEQFRKQSKISLELAEPIVRKHKMKLAVENHKDWRIPDMLKLLKHFDSEWIGVTLDTGNNLSLLEDPMEVVEALAPYTFNVHFKDMAYQEYEDGFLLSEVPLGEGELDLGKMRKIIEKHSPEANFNLEMITRDPLKVPCLSDKYWATFTEMPAQDLAHTLKEVRENKPQKPLPTVEGISPEERLNYEEENILASFAYAKAHLGFE